MTELDAKQRTGHQDARRAADRWTELKSNRSKHEQDWEDIARLIRPQRGGFNLINHTDRDMLKPLSSDPILAASSFAAGIYSGLTNPANRWFGLETPDEDFNAWKPMAEWNDIATARVLASFRPAMSSFYSSTFQAYSDIAAFGNAAGYDELNRKERKFMDVSISLGELVFDIDCWGRVWEVVRRFTLSPAAAIDMFGRENLPPKVIDLAEKRDRAKLVFFHHVGANTAINPTLIGRNSMPWRSVYACEMESWLISEGGYYEMPYYAPRWDVDSGHTYGTGPGFIALASARAAHQMDAASLRAAQYAADPTMLAPDRQDWPLNGHVRPGVVVYGGMNMQGQQMLRPLQTGGGIGLTMDEKRAKLEEIRNAFHYALMTVQGRTGMTSEETLIMEEARMRNWAPHSDRIMEEYAAKKVERRFRMLWRAGQIPPPPQEAAGLPMQVRYQSAASMAMKAREGMAIKQFINDLAPLAQTSPRYLDRLDPDATIEALHEAAPSLPARLLRSREDADQLAAQRAQQEQAAQMLQAAETGAGAMKDMAAAGAMSGMEGMQ